MNEMDADLQHKRSLVSYICRSCFLLLLGPPLHPQALSMRLGYLSLGL